MAFKQGLFKTSVARKNLMATTGLFIVFFLIIHLAGNLILILPDSFFPVDFFEAATTRENMYNHYSHFLVHFWPITLVAWVLYAAIAVHALDALLITLNNNKAKGEKYQVTDNSTSSWNSRNMGLLGVAILAFIIMHMGQFWLQYKVLGTEENLYKLVLETFKTPWIVAVYEIGIIAMGFHMVHGIQAAHRSLGIYPAKAMIVVKHIALCLAIAMSVLYGIIPIIMYFN
jgi:succinate dehydrogenase / fumarate reductase cytochrome b subunit